MKGTLRVGSGIVGATSVALLNYLGSRYLPRAPRLDILGLQLAAAAFDKVGIRPPRGLPMKILALVGSLVSNSMFYGLVGLGTPRTAWLRGAALGLAMGVGVLTLPAALGVGERETGRPPIAKVGTLAWYVLGGILAAITFAASQDEGKHRKRRSH
jgi:hypothetical protein